MCLLRSSVNLILSQVVQVVLRVSAVVVRMVDKDRVEMDMVLRERRRDWDKLYLPTICVLCVDKIKIRSNSTSTSDHHVSKSNCFHALTMNRLRPWLVFGKQPRLTQPRGYQSIRTFSLKQKDGYNVILPTEPYIWGVSHIQPRLVPDHIAKPPYARGVPVPTEKNPLQDRGKIELGGEAELKIREAAILAKKVREFAGTQVKVRLRLWYHCSRNWLAIQVGTTTNAVDAAIHDFIISHSAYPSPLLYSGFPRSCCTRYVIYIRNQLWDAEH